MTYILTETAEGELDAILFFIAERDGVARALHILAEFEDAFRALDATPLMGTVKEELTGPDQRWWWVFRFGIIYKQNGDDVVILRIVHGARDLDALFDE